MIHITILTLFPDIFPGSLGVSVLARAQEKGLWRLEVINIRDFATDHYKSVDGPCVGGGAGMVMRPDVLHRAILHGVSNMNSPEFLYLSPRGRLLGQEDLRAMAAKTLIQKEHIQKKEKNIDKREGVLRPHGEWIVLCGRYEGVDERLLRWWDFQEWSIGDFVLCGGESAAMILIEGYLRLIPGVLGNPESLIGESFAPKKSPDSCAPYCPKSALLLEHPLYTQPHVWNSLEVPPVLKTGHHKKIAQWKHWQSLYWTEKRRPDLWNRYAALCSESKQGQ